MANARRGLGKGLDTMIPVNKDIVSKSVKEEKELKKEAELMVKLSKIEPNREQPRKNFDEDALQELSDSIKQFGLLQPILVQQREDYYEIIAGERRWRASKLAGLKEVPVIIKNYTDQEIAEISLIENLQREDLNPIEEAKGYRRLIEVFHLKQDEVAEKVSKDRSTITNIMRLLNLCDEVQNMVIDGKLSNGQARTLLGIKDNELQLQIAEKIFDEKLSVREVEKLIKQINSPEKEKKNKELPKNVEYIYKEIENKLKEKMNRKVEINAKENGKGKIEIEFYTNEDLERLTEFLSTIDNK